MSCNPYPRRGLAFIDILGWSNLVCESVTDPSILKPIRTAFKWMLNAKKVASQVQLARGRKPFAGKYVLQEVAQFSDTIVLSCDATAESLGHLLHITQQLCIRLLISPRTIFTRGAVVVGGLLHKGNVIWGPALIEAHHKEQAGKYPRIIISDDVVQLLGYNRGGATKSAHPICKDKDNKYFIDLIEEKRGSSLYSSEALMKNLDRKIGLDAMKPPGKERSKIMAKNRWMKNYLGRRL